MSRWTHVSCQLCWNEKNPNRPAVSILDSPERICCFCGLKTQSGIYVRGDPKTLRCKGEHEL